jgi:hypothetical protein
MGRMNAKTNGRAGSVAVGSKSFIESVKASLGFRAKGRDIIPSGEGYPVAGEPRSL